MIHINLIEYREIKKKILIQQQLVASGGLLALSVFIMMCLTSLQNGRIGALQHTISIKQNELNKLKAQVRKVKEFENRQIRLKEMLKVIKSLKNRQRGTSRILDEINIQVPGEIWLISISEKNNIFDIAGYSFSNVGIASFMKNLEKSIYFKNVELIGSEQNNVGGKKIKKFTIKCNVNMPKKTV